MKLNVCWLFGLILLFVSPLYAQVDLGVSTDKESYKRMYILNVGLGFGCPDAWGNGISSWDVGRNENNSGFVSSAQLMTYTSHSVIGYGVYYFDFRDRAKHYDRALSKEVGEKTSLYYVGPQISFIKRRTAFPKGVGYINAGVGYAHYKSKGVMMQVEDYKTFSSGIGCNVGIAYEYAFDARMGIRLAVDCVYARLKSLHKDKAAYPDELSISPRKSMHLFVPSLELGLSYYMFSR